jgi:hypothetical protein
MRTPSFFASAVALLTSLTITGCLVPEEPTDDDSSDEGDNGGDGTSPTVDASVRDAALDASVRDAAPAPDAGPPKDPSGPFSGTAPRATCAPGGKSDGKVSGLSGDFSCNLSVASSVAAPHYLATAYKDDCFYVNGPDGTTVIKVAADGTPTVTATLTTVGFRSNWESMKANPVSNLLVGYEANGSKLTVYDIKECSKPVFKSTVTIGGLISVGHAGNFSPDGTIYYASSMYTASLYAMDLTDPAKPKLITDKFDRQAHDLYVSNDGKRGYFAMPNVLNLGIGSFALMDLTDVQARKPGATGKLISEIKWDDGNTSQFPVPVTYGGKNHVIITDELGSGNCNDPKKPQWGYARILNLSDEKNPKLASLIKTEAQDPSNCKGQGGLGDLQFGVGTHYCNVDRLNDPRVLACGNWDGGLRVYDIRNPAKPRELAYFDTAAGGMPGLARIVPEKKQIWLAFTPGTFYVLKIADGSDLATILSQD